MSRRRLSMHCLRNVLLLTLTTYICRYYTIVLVLFPVIYAVLSRSSFSSCSQCHTLFYHSVAIMQQYVSSWFTLHIRFNPGRHFTYCLFKVIIPCHILFNDSWSSRHIQYCVNIVIMHTYFIVAAMPYLVSSLCQTASVWSSRHILSHRGQHATHYHIMVIMPSNTVSSRLSSLHCPKMVITLCTVL